MSEVKTHKDLEVWKNAINLVTDVYKVTDNFPKAEEFGLKSQIRRASVSIAVNISEGAARNSTKEFIQFLYLSLGSLSEFETLLIISKNLHLAKDDNLLDKAVVLRKMLLKLIKSLRDR